MKLDVREQRAPQRCPMCHGDLRPSEPLWECQACGAVHHGACAREHGRCATLGCTGAPSHSRLEIGRDPEAERRELRRARLRAALFWTCFLASAALAIAGFLDGLRVMNGGGVTTTTSLANFTPVTFIVFVCFIFFAVRDRLR